MKMKLQEYFCERIVQTEIDGKPNVTFRTADDDIQYFVYSGALLQYSFWPTERISSNIYAK